MEALAWNLGRMLEQICCEVSSRRGRQLDFWKCRGWFWREGFRDPGSQRRDPPPHGRGPVHGDPGPGAPRILLG
jgi:hypothetical protein